jgi:hypothetical protein
VRQACLIAVLCASCASGGGKGGPHDLAAPRDLAFHFPDDLASAPDLAKAAPGDLATGDDLTAPANCAITINEIQTAGTVANDEFIELYSSCAMDTDLTGYKLVYRSAAGVNDVSFLTFAMLSIPAHGYLVAGQNAYIGMSDVKYGSSMSATGGGLALKDPNGATVDSVGWGTATNAYVETTAAPAPAASKSLERLPDGQDSDDNSKDFKVGMAPTPQKANQ